MATMIFYDDIDDIIEREDYALLSLLRKRLHRKNPLPSPVNDPPSHGTQGQRKKSKNLNLDMDADSEESTLSLNLEGTEEEQAKLGNKDGFIGDMKAASFLKTFKNTEANMWQGNLHLPNDRVYIIKQNKDGACLYTSIAEWLKLIEDIWSIQDLANLHNLKPSKGGRHTLSSKNKEKQTIAERLKKVANDFIICEQASLLKANIVDQPEVDYAKRAMEGNQWGGMSQVYAISLILDTPIAVWTKEEGNVYKLCDSTFKVLETIKIRKGDLQCSNEGKCIIHLLYVNSHYDTLIVTDAEQEASV